MTFTVEVDQNSYLPAGIGRVDAIVTVQAPDTPVAAPPADALEIIILDCSTSMSGDRISAPPAGLPRRRSRRCATASRSR
jgi:hypothetical protein